MVRGWLASRFFAIVQGQDASFEKRRSCDMYLKSQVQSRISLAPSSVVVQMLTKGKYIPSKLFKARIEFEAGGLFPVRLVGGNEGARQPKCAAAPTTLVCLARTALRCPETLGAGRIEQLRRHF